MRLASVSRRFVWLLVVVATAGAGLGCGSDEIRTYEAPKDAASRVPPGGGDLRAQAPPETPGPRVSWTLPAGWREVPGSGMRHATLLLDGTDHAPEVRVTPLGLAARDPLANVNRWREQIGLAPVDAAGLETVLRTVDAGGHPVRWVDLTGPAHDAQPAQQCLAAMLEDGDTVWFFVLMDTAERAKPHVAEFERFLGTIRLGAGEAMAAPDHAAAKPLPPGGPPEGAGPWMTWKVPAGWEAIPGSNTMRLASFAITHAEQTGEVAITRFPGDVGGLLANLNRWRNQVGLPPVQDAAQQPATSLVVAGKPALRFDLMAAGPHDPERLVVVFVEHAGMTWFIKMTGSRALVEAQVPVFDAFVGSIGFEESS